MERLFWNTKAQICDKSDVHNIINFRSYAAQTCPSCNADYLPLVSDYHVAFKKALGGIKSCTSANTK